MSVAFAHIQRFLRTTAGLAFEHDKRYFVEARLKPVLRDAGLSGLDDLARALRADARSELARLVTETLTINETSFFRDRALFTALGERFLPRLIEARAAARRLRIWCAGCSTGQEPFSVAMLVDEAMRQRPGWRVEILATDLSRAAVEQARRGTYSQFEVQRGLPVALLLRHFTRRGDLWQINDPLRARVAFEAQNLMSAPPDGDPFDVVFCRNVLFYFDAATKRQVLGRLGRVLADDGILALGGAERIGELCPALQPEPTAPFVFVRAQPAHAGAARRVAV